MFDEFNDLILEWWPHFTRFHMCQKFKITLNAQEASEVQ